jgi:hypothetical protein
VGKGGDRGKEEEMTQTLYAHMNKKKKKKDQDTLVIQWYLWMQSCNHRQWLQAHQLKKLNSLH